MENREIIRELEMLAEETVLAPWREHILDTGRGLIVPQADRHWRPDFSVPLSGVLCARILWTFSRGALHFSSNSYREGADLAFQVLTERFLDGEYGGIYWDAGPEPHRVTSKKQIYAQAFALYGCVEYHRLTGNPRARELAWELFSLIETHGRDRNAGGYREAAARDWSGIEDYRLSDRDLNAPKSMNTHLHVLEAYTQLVLWEPREEVREAQRSLLEIFARRIIDPETGHFLLFFLDDWSLLGTHDSYGHDIEGSWLLWEAACALGEPEVKETIRPLSLALAGAALEGVDADGGLYNEGKDGEIMDSRKDWWPQAEALVGFLHAWQLTGRKDYLKKALGALDFIRTRLLDPESPGWFWGVNRDGSVYDSRKAGPWQCPYHTFRAFLEAADRLKIQGDKQ